MVFILGKAQLITSQTCVRTTSKEMAELSSQNSSDINSQLINDGRPPKKPLETTKIFHICILGAKGTGKTTLCGQFTGKFVRRNIDNHRLPRTRKAPPSSTKPKVFKSVINGNQSNLHHLSAITSAVDIFHNNILQYGGTKTGNVGKRHVSSSGNNTKGPLRANYAAQLRDMPALNRMVSIKKFFKTKGESKQFIKTNNKGQAGIKGLKIAESQPNNLLHLLNLKTIEEEMGEKYNTQKQESAKKSKKNKSSTNNGNYSSDGDSNDDYDDEGGHGSNGINSLYTQVSDKSWAYVILFDPRYETSIEYAKTVILDMKTSTIKKRFEKAVIVLFANKYDLGDFTMNPEYREIEKIANDFRLISGNITVCHGSALNGSIFFHPSPDIAFRSYRMEHNITEFIHMIALEMKERSIYGQGDVQKYNARLLTPNEDLLTTKLNADEKDDKTANTLNGFIGHSSGIGSLLGCCGGNRE